MNKDINLKDIGMLLWRHIVILVIITIIGGIAGYCYASFLLKPYYTASVSMIVTSGANRINQDATVSQITTAEQNAASALVSTYSVIIKSDRVCKEVSEDLKKNGLNYSAGSIKGMMSVSRIDETQVMRVTVRGGKAKDVAAIANAISRVAEVQLPGLMQGGNAQTLDSASVPSKPAGPNKTTYVLEGMLLCACLTAGVIFLIYLLDTKIKNEEDLHSVCQIPVVGSIPHVEQ